MQKLSKFILFLFTTVSLFSGYYIIKASTVVADVDAIPEPIVPCDEQKNPEFNSLRPYQASPCGDAPKAAFCNNDYIIEEKVNTPWTSACDDVNFTCPYNKPPMIKDYTIYMSDVTLPILGNTQDELDNAQKMNEYLTWYLSGTNQKAEDGNDSIDETINYSGPLKKLLPSTIQEFQRFSVLHKAGAEQEYTDFDEIEGSPLDEDQNKDGVQIKEKYNHNQIVVCTTKNIRIFGFNIDNPWIGQEIPTPCYGTAGTSSTVTSGVTGVTGGIVGNLIVNAVGNLGGTNNKKAEGTVLRLLDWWEGRQVNFSEALEVIEGWDGSERWGSSVPPFPWQFTEEIYYQKAYREWRGHECVIILGKLLCADLKIEGVAELHSNRMADFYQYIPLGTPADKTGVHVIGGVNIKGLGDTIAGRPQDASGNSEADTYTIEQNPILYYPHTQSSYDMLKILNKTQAPDGMDGNIRGRSDPTSPTQSDFETGVCKVVEVRSNDGDDLTFSNGVIDEKQKAYVRDVKIEVTQVGCDGIKEWFDDCGSIPNPLSDTNKCRSFPTCSGTVQVVIKSTPRIPFSDQIWKASTVGQESAFRRIFPKVEEGAPVSCIADIPGVSDATYDSSGKLVSIDTPAGKKSADEAELYFPHLGTVYEYFLSGIQTALRPKGYGEQIVNGTLCSNVDGGDCSFDMNKVNSGIAKASAKYNVPAELLRGMFELESLPYIAGVEEYSCDAEKGGVIGVAQFKSETAKLITCGDEFMDKKDIGVCGKTEGKLSRCNIEDSFELMARLLLLHSGKLNNCQSTGSMSMDNKNEWWSAACKYGEGFGPSPSGATYQNAIPANERPIGRDMNYCDILCHRMGYCPSYPNLP